jgi:hypothetical protein
MVSSVASERSPVTQLGIDPETLGLIAQCLNHYATPGTTMYGTIKKFFSGSQYGQVAGCVEHGSIGLIFLLKNMANLRLSEETVASQNGLYSV